MAYLPRKSSYWLGFRSAWVYAGIAANADLRGPLVGPFFLRYCKVLRSPERLVPKPIRFFYVRSPTSTVIHLSSAKVRVEGELTWCGRRMQAGWLFNYGLRSVPKGSSICAQCEKQRQ